VNTINIKKLVLLGILMVAIPIGLTFLALLLKVGAPCVWPMSRFQIALDDRPLCPTFNRIIRESKIISSTITLGTFSFLRLAKIDDVQKHLPYPIFFPRYLPPPYSRSLFAGSALNNHFYYEFYKSPQPILAFTLVASPFAEKDDDYFEESCSGEGTFLKNKDFPFGACLHKDNSQLSWLPIKATLIVLEQKGTLILSSEELQKIATSMTAFDSTDY